MATGMLAVVRKVLPFALIVTTGLLLTSCSPMPLFVGEGYLRNAVTGPDGRIHLVFADEGGVKYGVIDLISVTSELVTTEGDLGWHGLRGGFALDPQGRPHVLYGSNGNLMYAWKEAGSWESEVIAADTGCILSSPSMAIDPAGVVHVSYANSDCPTTEHEIRYARRDEGGWSDELVATDTGNYSTMPFVASRISVGPDQQPVIAVSASGSIIDAWCADASITLAEPMDGGGWQVEEVFFLEDDCTQFYQSTNEITDLSLAVDPFGKRAVGFISHTGSNAGWSSFYHIMVDEGTGWVDQTFCGGICQYFTGSPCAVDGRAQDIAYDQTGKLFSTFTRERLVGEYPNESVEQSISLARKTGSGWEEETLWDNSLYDAPVALREVQVGGPPWLLMRAGSTPRILYNTPGDSIPKIALLKEWF